MSDNERNSMVYQWRADTVDMLTLRKVSMGKRDNRTATSKQSDKWQTMTVWEKGYQVWLWAVELLMGINNKESKKESRQLTASHNLIDWLLKPVTDELIQVCQGWSGQFACLSSPKEPYCHWSAQYCKSGQITLTLLQWKSPPSLSGRPHFYSPECVGVSVCGLHRHWQTNLLWSPWSVIGQSATYKEWHRAKKKS